MIGIVDYGLGNVKAFANIYNALNVPNVIASRPADLDGVTRAILPGVGAFDQAMRRLQDSGMRDRLDEMVLHRKLPVLGVCVGMQILVGKSEEGVTPGLGWLEGEVIKFRSPPDGGGLRVPHMGWNEVRTVRSAGLMKGLESGARFYFLHSFVTHCAEPDALAVTDYGGEFACAVAHENIFGVQFHPEKSHRFGIRMLQNFAEL